MVTQLEKDYMWTLAHKNKVGFAHQRQMEIDRAVAYLKKKTKQAIVKLVLTSAVMMCIIVAGVFLFWGGR